MLQDDAQDNLIRLQAFDVMQRVALLLVACDAIEPDGFNLFPAYEWVEIYRLLSVLSNMLGDESQNSAVAPILLRLGLKIAVLEALIDTHVGSNDVRILH